MCAHTEQQQRTGAVAARIDQQRAARANTDNESAADCRPDDSAKELTIPFKALASVIDSPATAGRSALAAGLKNPEAAPITA